MQYLGNQSDRGIASQLSPRHYALKTSAGDELIFQEDIYERSSRLQGLVEKYEDEYPPLKELMQDVYYSFYKYDPELNPEESMDLDYLLNRQVMNHLMESSKYRKFRASTKLEAMSSQICTEIFAENIMGLIRDLAEKQEEAKKRAEEARKKIKKILEEKAKKGELPASKKYSLEEAKKALRKARKEMKDEFDSKQKRKLENKINISLNQHQETQDCIQNWGLGNDGSFQRKGYREKVDLINKLKESRKLKKISLLAGKLKETYLKGNKINNKRKRDFIQDVEQGNDLGRVIPTDLATLAMPGARRMFYKNYVNKTLRQHKYGGKSIKAKGPIVALIDTSMSMAGEKEVWSKAVALTLLDISRKQKRDFFVVQFDSGTHKDNLHTNSFTRHDPYNVEEVIDMAEFFGGGGTEFQPPLDRARDQIDQHKAFKTADIIMITDGQAAVSDPWLEDHMRWKQSKNITTYSVQIKGSYGSESTVGLEDFSDDIQQIDDLKTQGSSTAVDLFNNVDY